MRALGLRAATNELVESEAGLFKRDPGEKRRRSRRCRPWWVATTKSFFLWVELRSRRTGWRTVGRR